MLKHVSKHLTQTISYLSISCMFFIFFSCGSDSNHNKDHLVFRYNEHAGINTLDPAFSRTLQDNSINNQLFNGLVQLDTALNIKPCIAKY